MSENKTNWIAIIAVVVVVAVLASLITVNLTGNVIKVNSFSKPYGLQDVYTKTEIDAKLKNLGTSNTTSYTKSEIDAKFAAFETSIQNHLAGKYSDYVKALISENAKETTIRHVTQWDRNTTYGDMTCQQLCSETTMNRQGVQISGQDCMFGIGYQNNQVAALDHAFCERLIRDSLDQYGEQIACICD